MARTGIIFDACFNQAGSDEKLYGFYWHQNPPLVVASGSHGVAVREGTHYMECYLHRTESEYSYRTMGLCCAEDDMEPGTRERWMFDFDTDYWMAISMFLPDGWVEDPLSTILWQCQRTPDPEELYKQPCLYIAVKTDEWKIGVRWDTREFSPPEEGSHWPNSESLYSADFSSDLGTWTDWVFHVVWTWENDGLVEVWKNGNQIVDYSGGNCANDAKGPNMSLGIYEWSWREEYWEQYEYIADWRRLWMDSVRIGDATSSYDDVKPGEEGEAAMTTASIVMVI